MVTTDTVTLTINGQMLEAPKGTLLVEAAKLIELEIPIFCYHSKLKPVGGFCAETGGAITLFIATGLGIPVSTTHTITGAIVGVGAVRKLSAVRWGIARRIVWAWVLTIPCAGLISALAWWVARHLA